jgi:hypothetical protein
LLSRFRLWHLLLVFVVLGAWVSVTVPLGEGPDELPHYTVTRYIIQHGRLPDTAEEHESFQPPLYYLLSAVLTFWIDTRDFVVKANADYDPLAPDAPKMLLLHGRAEAFPYQGWALAWHLMRLLSLAMGAVTIAALYTSVLTITRDRKFALLCAALVAFLPGFIFMSALVSNDNLAAMLAALICWRIALLLQAPSPAGRPRSNVSSFILLGLLLGFGLLSKTSMLAFVATIGLALQVAARRGHWPWHAWLNANILVFGVAALLSGWYFVRNVLLYGDWLAWPLVLAANEVRTAPPGTAAWLHVLGQTYRSFWLEWIGIALDPAAQLILALFAVLALLGLIRYIIRRTETASRVVLALLIVHLLVIVVSWVRWTQTVAGTGQARLFYPALLTLILALALGLRALHPRLPWALAGVLLVAALVAPLRNIAPAYAAAPRIAALPASAQPISATFKDKLRLVGWELPIAPQRPGDTLVVGLYWQALKDGDEDDWLKIQLLDPQDKFLLFKDGSPSAGRDVTDSWRRGELIASWHRLLIPANAPFGNYRLTVGIHPYGRKNWFPIQEENMWIALTDQLVLAEVTIE